MPAKYNMDQNPKSIEDLILEWVDKQPVKHFPSIYKYEFKEPIKSEKWFKRGDQWIGPNGQSVKIQNDTE